jgi:hypothetical protein
MSAETNETVGEQHFVLQGQGFARHETSDSYSDVWLTPDPYVLPLGEFDLDPCAWPGRLLPNCREHYFERGLEREWVGRVFMNAPYSILEGFVRRFYKHRQGIALTFLRAETKLFFRYVWPHASGILIPNRRIAFLNSDGKESGNCSGTASVYFTESDARVLRECSIPGAFIAGADVTRKCAKLSLFD